MLKFKHRGETGGLKAAQKHIIAILYAANKPLTTQEIANKVGITRPTARKYLINLQGKNKVEGGRLGKSIYWWLVV